MRPEEKHNDDLDYLAQQGFERVASTEADLAGLKRRIRKRSVSFRPFNLVLGSLALGVLIGMGVFVILSEPGVMKSGQVGATHESKITPHQTEVESATILLDTIFVVNENFIKPVKTSKSRTKGPSSVEAATADSALVIVAKPLDLTTLGSGELEEKKLKYMVNSPVFYLHDMKITNYTVLYFKKNHFVRYTGLSAAYSNTAEAAHAGARLKQSADYYLHEEIANAMRFFKNGNYDRAIVSLKTVSSYNDTDVNCDFYLAMCYHYKKSHTQAIEFFDRCIDSPNNTFLQEAMYYKAISLLESGSKEAAKKLFEKIVNEDEFYAVKARGYLKE